MPLAKAIGKGVKVVGQELLIPWQIIEPFPDQPRRYFNEDGLQQLAKSIKRAGQRTPIEVRPLTKKECKQRPDKMYQLIDGQRRWFAVQIADIDTLRATVQHPNDAGEQYLMSVVANFGRDPHPPLEIRNACIKLQELGHSVEEIAELICKSVPTVYLYLRLANLHPDIELLLSAARPEKERLSVNVAVQLAKLRPEHQQSALERITGSGGRIRDASRVVESITRGAPEARHPEVRVRRRRASDDIGIFTSTIGKLTQHASDLRAIADHTEGLCNAIAPARRAQMRTELATVIEQLQSVSDALQAEG